LVKNGVGSDLCESPDPDGGPPAAAPPPHAAGDSPVCSTGNGGMEGSILDPEP